MTILFIILIILACVVLTLVVLVQNPKGGGLAGNIGGFSNQFMGVKQTTDVLEKAPGSLPVLLLSSALFPHFLSLAAEVLTGQRTWAMVLPTRSRQHPSKTRSPLLLQDDN